MLSARQTVYAKTVLDKFESKKVKNEPKQNTTKKLEAFTSSFFAILFLLN